jgi:hypothetical protein
MNNKINHFLFFIILIAVTFVSNAQSFHHSYHSSGRGVKINLQNITVDFKPVLQNMEAPVPGGNSYASFLLQQKQKIKSSSTANKKAVSQNNADKPLVLAGFGGNLYDGSVPTDNDVAISNGNMLVSVANSTIYMFDMNQDTLVKKISLEAFADTLGLPANMYDPRIVYDPKQDRFIMVWLSGSSSGNSDIVVCFSETNEPTGNWFFYALPGNPLNDSSWTDYPQIALTDDEIFITGNLLQDKIPNDNRPDAWKFYFRQSIIWQINKAEGFTGDSLKTKLHSNILFQGVPVRYISPVQGGSTTYGPNIYFLSNKPFDIVNDTFFVLEITGRQDNVSSQLILKVLKSSTSYGVPPDGKQRNNHFLLTNDARVLDGYIENDKIHFVMNCVNPDTVRAALYHGMIENVSGNKSISGNIVGSEMLDYGYPNISYTGKYAGDEEAIISFNHTSVDTVAGFSAVFYNGNTQEYSERVSLKTGDSFINVLPGNTERWGDYSGSQRKYNEPGKVWLTGFFGSRRQMGGPVYSLANYTWVAALQSPDTAATASVLEKKHFAGIKTYPNPSSDIFTAEFELAENTFITIELFSAEGKKVKTLLQDKAKQGKNVFSFSTQPLANGAFYLIISENGKTLSSNTILKQQH